jgi:hypothetical protein
MFIRPSVYLPICVTLHLHFFHYIHLSICPVHSSICLICPFTHLLIFPSANKSIYLYVPSICPSVYLPICPFVHLSIRPSVHLPVFTYGHPSVFICSLVHLPILTNVCLFICVSLHQSVCLSIYTCVQSLKSCILVILG